MNDSSDHIIRGLVREPLVRVVATLSTEVARTAATRHSAGPAAAVALGRSAASALLLATLTKSGERVTLQIDGDGPLGRIMADATDAGDVRAAVAAPDADVAADHSAPARLAPGTGRGTVSVLRDLGLENRFTGQAPLISGEIDADIEHYLRTSEQVDSALGADVQLSADGQVVACAGVLAQCMPDEDGGPVVAEVRHKLRNGRLWSALVDPEGPTDAEGLLRALLGEHAGQLDVLDVRPVRFSCPCSAERVTAALRTVDSDTLEAMIREDGGAEVTCDYCREVYRLTGDELRGLRGS